ncbi:Saccharopine dehydrogenase / Homospermidine synthase [Macrophomina phaseolina MS6]|uniref:Saccharopine dehydrogenase / Homospermidine synthase n=1 Tax=Macrophomina phaseolina (strain MS6) TaxID=1126212 RepID=K2ST78_MACPH|nr:Saccharopine dehydrogenase / Homospermidine synthase [Macrophomina phaseolina MS6]
MAKLLIYGASGYTGILISHHLKSLGLDFVLAGRSKPKVANLATALKLPFCVFDLGDRRLIDNNLHGATVLLNCAGPYMHTAEPLIEACIHNEKDEEVRQAGVMLLPGCGGISAMLQCLAARAVEQVKDPVHIDIAIHLAGPTSRGTIISARKSVSASFLQRVDGELVEQELSATEQFDFEDGKGHVACLPMSLPNLIILWRSMHVKNIRTFVHTSGGAFSDGEVDALPDGPTAEERDANPYHAVVAVTGKDGTTKREVLHTVNGYAFTFITSAKAAQGVLAGETRGGFETSAGLFGHEFIFEMTERNDV